MTKVMLGGINASSVRPLAQTPVARPLSYLCLSISGTARRAITAAAATLLAGAIVAAAWTRRAPTRGELARLAPAGVLFGLASGWELDPTLAFAAERAAEALTWRGALPPLP